MIIVWFLAELGNAKAQYQIGHDFLLQRNYERAERWLYRSAQKGDDSAGKAWVRLVKQLSEEWDRHSPTSLDWYHLITAHAQAGFPEAQFQRGLLDEYGQTYANMKAALIWYHKSAQSFYPPALLKLGIVYDMGLGVRRNKWLARHYFRLGGIYESYR